MATTEDFTGAAKRDRPSGFSDVAPEKKARAVPTGDFQSRCLITNEESGIVIGKAGSNISAVRAATSTTIMIDKGGKGIEERVMAVKGQLEGVVKALQIIQSRFLQEKSEKIKAEGGEGLSEMTFRILIHQHQAGAIIGKAGARIQEIQESTGCKVQLSKQCLADSTEKTVTLTGQLAALQTATQKIVQLLAENPLRPGNPSMPFKPIGQGQGAPGGSYGGYGSPYGAAPSPYGVPQPMPPQQFGGFGGPQGFPPQQAPQGYGGYQPQRQAQAPAGVPPVPVGGSETDQVAIPSLSAGAVIGKGGNVITSIKQQSGTQIIIDKPEPSNPDERVVRITGSRQGIETAVAMIKLRVESALQGGGGGAGAASTPAPGSSAEQITIPTNCAGVVIGKGGSVISNIKTQSGTTIVIDKPDPSNPKERVVHVTGSPIGIQTAIAMIKQRVDAELTGGASLGLGGEVTEKVKIPTSAAGAVIGKGGKTINDIKAQSGCQILLSPFDSASMERIVTISGSAQGVQTALFMVHQRVQSPNLPQSTQAPNPYDPSAAAAAYQPYGAPTHNAYGAPPPQPAQYQPYGHMGQQPPQPYGQQQQYPQTSPF